MKAKPFVKWAGGKGGLLKQLDLYLPADFDEREDVTYIEPFVGGGAMLFHMLNTHKNIKRIIINDINKDLIAAYRIIKKDPERLIKRLKAIETEYLALDPEARTEYYYRARTKYNQLPKNGVLSPPQRLKRVVYFMFLNHTCFNGLYRENLNGEFNVPQGRYANPSICSEDVLRADHEILKDVEILCGKYSAIHDKIKDGYTFIYFDPPYRPLSNTSNFNDYNSSGFGDRDQIELKTFCDYLTGKRCKIMLSNSDSYEKDNEGNKKSFFERVFQIGEDPQYTIDRIVAPRFINSVASKRKDTKEILIRNYK